MKRIAITVLGVIIVALSFGQYQEINNGESGLSVRTKMNAMHAELYQYNLAAEYSADGTNWHSPPKLTTDKYVRFSGDQGGRWSSPALYYFDGINLIDSLQLNGNKISGLAAGTEPTDGVNVQQLSDSISAATGISGSDPALLNSDTLTIVVTYDSLTKILQETDIKKYVYVISLPGGSGISDRLTGSYTAPDGWTLTAGSNDIDLKIEHNLDRRLVNATVFSNLSGTEQLLVNSAGFTSITTTDSNNATIGSLATQIITPIKLYLFFE
jgi:hypothetical protein